MKIKPIFGVSVCLLLTYASLPLNAENHECSNTLVRGTSTQPVTVSDVPVTPTPPTRPTTLVRGTSTQPVTVSDVPVTPTPPTRPTTLEKPDFCLLEQDEGICRALLLRYFYNNESKHCELFFYGGCLGNKNNFQTEEECKNTCENPLSSTSTPPVPVPVTPTPPTPTTTLVYVGPSWCLTPADRGLCSANVTRFYFDSVSMKCLTFSYSGCGGNENNFTSRQSCRRACRKGFIKKGSKGGLRKDKRIRKKHSVGI
ncbi:tissue factor pathway inhibitor isoform X3 [Desmodus rotundus]|uniref:tissue factor pathway inhibitor isoform X3 n=1 Tax=Desmodus rotundus TaxID=9430 RepID=UPI0039E2B527